MMLPWDQFMRYSYLKRHGFHGLAFLYLSLVRVKNWFTN